MKFLPFFLIFWACSTPYKANSFLNVDVIEVYDDDTFKIHLKGYPRVFGEKLSIRINGIDTPEKRTKNKCEKKAALEAREVLSKLLRESSVDLMNCQRGKYFRLACSVYANGKSVEAELLGRGLAYKYRGGTKKKIDWCNDSQKRRSE